MRCLLTFPVLFVSSHLPLFFSFHIFFLFIQQEEMRVNVERRVREGQNMFSAMYQEMQLQRQKMQQVGLRFLLFSVVHTMPFPF